MPILEFPHLFGQSPLSNNLSEDGLANSNSNILALLSLILGATLLFLFGYCCYCCFYNEQKDMGIKIIADHHEHDE